MIKISVVIMFALAATALLRKRSAAVRHWVLSAAVVCAAATPALELIVPSWQVRLNTPSLERIEPSLPRETQPERPADTSRMFANSPGIAVPPLATAGHILRPIWLAGIGISVFVLFVGFGRLAWLASRSERVVGGRWIDLAEEISREYGLNRPVALLHSDHPTLVVTWGLIQPKVILPAAAREWSEDRMRIVLCHELAHVGRGDWLVQMIAELLRSAYWFNPLVWVACRRLRRESEHACDDAVLNCGVAGPEYATHLLELARAVKTGRHIWSPAPAIARPSSLERRITAMLNARLNRSPITRSNRFVTATAVLGLTILVAGFGAAAQTAFATFSGSVVDPQEAFLPGVTLVLTNVQSQAKHEVRSDRAGRFEFVGLPPADYFLETRLPGFATLAGKLTISGQNMQQDIKLQIGSIEETITVSDTDEAAVAARSLAHISGASSECPGFSLGNAPPIGGNIKVPRKVTHVRPTYPQQLAPKIDGRVEMEGRIGTDGFINRLEVVGQAQPDLANAALEAVRQWEFSPTLLNCVPIEVPIKVHVNFTAQR